MHFSCLCAVVLWRENFVLSVWKFDQRANHAFEMTYGQWKSTDPPPPPPPPNRRLQLSCIFYHTTFMRATSVTSPLELLPRVIFTDAIKKSKYLTSVIITWGLWQRTHQGFMIILGGDDISRTRTSTQMQKKPQNFWMAQMRRSQMEAEAEADASRMQRNQTMGL